MKKSFIKGFDRIILLVLGMLGFFTGCNKNEVIACEYGVPNAAFEINGVVTNLNTSAPINQIQVVRGKILYDGRIIYRDTAYTDNEGNYVINYEDFPDMNYRLKFEDIDGEENGGRFLSKERDVIFTEDDRVKADNGWYWGGFTKTQNVELEQVYEAPLYGSPSSEYKP